MKKIFYSIALALCALTASTIYAAPAPTGALTGLFQINDNGDQVWFSRGNLQYQASTNTFQFAANQYAAVGAANSSISSSNSGWIDLFGYGTSGYNNVYPYKSEMGFSGYGTGDETDIAGTDYDWGVHNKISNGGNQAGLWRTLTSDEWYYIFSKHLHYQATVNGQTGLILLPKDFVNPGITLQYSQGKYTENTLSSTQWTQLQNAGAVFLPAGGMRTGTEVNDAGTHGYYWSSTNKSSSTSYAVYVLFQEGNVYYGSTYSQPMCYGYHVRLVADRVIDTYGVTVDGVKLTELNYTDPLNDGKVSYNPSTKVLTLTSATIVASTGVTNVIQSDEAVTILLEGTNSIKNTHGAAFNLANGSVIRGEGEAVISSTQGASRSELAFNDGLGIAGAKAYNTNMVYITAITTQALSPEFSVAANNTVQFTLGNLLYNAQLDIWRFAQAPYIYHEDEATDPLKGKWSSLHQWDENQWSDAVIYNSNNQSNQWRLLTINEWQYLLFQRAEALYKYSKGSVEGVIGLIVLPDSWTLPDGLSFVNNVLWHDGDNAYSASDWVKMETNGAVFLPVDGFIQYSAYNGNYTPVYNKVAYLWTADPAESGEKAYMEFSSGNPDLTKTHHPFCSMSVRLVKGAQSSATAIEEVGSENANAVRSEKVLRDGQLYILRGEKMYNAQGVEIR